MIDHISNLPHSLPALIAEFVARDPDCTMSWIAECVDAVAHEELSADEIADICVRCGVSDIRDAIVGGAA